MTRTHNRTIQWTITRVADFLADAGLAVAGVLLVFMTAYALVESVLRSTFGTSTFVMTELVGYAMAPMTTLAMARTLRGGMLIRVNLLTARLSTGTQRLMELLCVVVVALLTAYLIWLFAREASFNWSRGAVSDTIARIPLWIPSALLLSGLPLFMLHLVLYGVEIIAGRPLIADTDESAGI